MRLIEPDAYLGAQAAGRVLYGMRQLQGDRDIGARRRLGELEPVGPDQDLVAGPHRSGIDRLPVDVDRRRAELIHVEAAVALLQRRGRQFHADISEENLVVGAAPEPNPVGANPLRATHNCGAASGEYRDLNLHAPRRSRRERWSLSLAHQRKKTEMIWARSAARSAKVNGTWQ